MGDAIVGAVGVGLAMWGLGAYGVLGLVGGLALTLVLPAIAALYEHFRGVSPPRVLALPEARIEAQCRRAPCTRRAGCACFLPAPSRGRRRPGGDGKERV